MTWKNLASPVSRSSSSRVRLLHSENPAYHHGDPQKDLGEAGAAPEGAPLSKLLRLPHRSRLHWGLKEARAFS